ncbi:hypothetical protein PENTCL1PPCAC_2950, partial [Pristionchus entomophagus]
FPLLDLPNEIISIILQQLPSVDRLLARVNQKLFMLESFGRYSIRELSIGREYDDENKEEDENKKNTRDLEISLIGPCSSYLDVLTKIARNTTVESLFFLCDVEERQLIPYVKATRARKLTVAMDQEIGRDEINDDLLDEWLSSRMCLNIQMGGLAVTGEALFRVFRGMTSGMLLQFRIGVLAEAGRSVLHLLGIAYAKGSFTSRRKDARFFVNDITCERNFFIFIGVNMMITVSKRMLRSDIEGDFSIERYTEDQSVHNILHTLQPFPVVY